MRFGNFRSKVILWAAMFVGVSSPVLAGQFNVLFSFNGTNGSNPLAGLLNLNGRLLGTTSGNCISPKKCPEGGSIFAIKPATDSTRFLHMFTGGTDGWAPETTLVNIAGVVYGETSGGVGTLFKVDPVSGAVTTLYTFAAKPNDGFGPTSPLLNIDGILYGVTGSGGTAANGTENGIVYSFNPTTSIETVLYTFQGSNGGGTDGATPYGPLANVGGLIYGTTYGGGVTGGTVYTVNPASGEETIVHTFGGKGDGGNPVGGLINAGGKLYGTTLDGGSSPANGSVFSVDPVTGSETILYSFQGGSDGSRPTGALLYAGGLLYGTTTEGGSANCPVSGCGILFSIDPSTGVETVLYQFQGGALGNTPASELIMIGGTLYGTTQVGGSKRCKPSGCGIVFSYTP